MANRIKLDAIFFNWNTHGDGIFSKFMPITTSMISLQMKLAFEMTREYFADEKGMNTADFRSSIIYYLKQINGFKDETFRYGLINKIFTI